MNVFSDNCPITSKIDSIDETIKELNERIEILDDQLRRLNDLTEQPEKDERKAIQFELTEIKKLVQTHEEGLKKLRAQNRKSFMFVALFVFAAFLIYCTYILIVGYD